MPCCNGLDSRAPPGGFLERTSTRARHRGRVELEVEQTRNPIPRYFSVKSNTVRNVCVLSEIIHDLLHVLECHVSVMECLHTDNRKVLNSIWPFPRRFLAFSEEAIRQIRERLKCVSSDMLFREVRCRQISTSQPASSPFASPASATSTPTGGLPLASPNLQYGSLLVQKVGRCRH